MKNKLIILLIPLFVFSTAGFSITSLYCQGKLCEVGFSVHPCCSDVNKGGCCQTESVFFKIADGFVKAGNDADLKSFNFDKPVIHFLSFSNELSRHLQSTVISNDWQDKLFFTSPAARILFCSFLI